MVKRTILLLSVLLLGACYKTPDAVWVEKPGLYPEGVEVHPESYHFLVTSLREGAVGEVNDKGVYKLFIEDTRLVSAIGIRVDAKRDRILVANSDPGVSIKTSAATQKKIAGLGVYSLKDGSPIAYYELHKLYDGKHFANDIAVDKEGNIYVTDSFSPVIYKIDTNGKESVFLTNERFTGQGFNLNGIVLYEDSLIVAKYNEGILFKIPLSNPQEFVQIEIPQTFPGADGLLFHPDGDLIVIANASTRSVFKLHSEDKFQSAKVVAVQNEGWRYNTTGILRCKNVYVLNAELNKLFGGEEPVQKFEIRKLKFPEEE